MNPFPDFAPDDERNDPIEAHPFAWRLVLSIVAIEVAVLGAFLWLVTR